MARLTEAVSLSIDKECVRTLRGLAQAQSRPLSRIVSDALTAGLATLGTPVPSLVWEIPDQAAR